MERPTVPTPYDYRLYDQIWRRVSPELNPYPEVRAASPRKPIPPQPPPAPAEPEPEALERLRRLMEEERDQGRHCLSLACRSCNPCLRRLLERLGRQCLGRAEAGLRLLEELSR